MQRTSPELRTAPRPNNHVALQDNVAAWKTMREMQWSHGDAMAVPDVSRGHHELGSVDQVRRFCATYEVIYLSALCLDVLPSAGTRDADERSGADGTQTPSELGGAAEYVFPALDVIAHTMS